MMTTLLHTYLESPGDQSFRPLVGQYVKLAAAIDAEKKQLHETEHFSEVNFTFAPSALPERP